MTHPAPPATIRDREATRARLIAAVGALLARQGFKALGINAVAREAGVDKVLIYRYFGGLPQLIAAFGQEGDFWPSISELTGGDPVAFGRLPLDERLRRLTRQFVTGIRRRPLTLEIMAWETVERNDLTAELEMIRENTMLRLAEMFFPAGIGGLDLQAAVALMGAGLSYLAVRARDIQWYNGIDIQSEAGWQRIEATVDRIVAGLLPPAAMA
jgi:AcrR family transcriptional regulator